MTQAPPCHPPPGTLQRGARQVRQRGGISGAAPQARPPPAVCVWPAGFPVPKPARSHPLAAARRRLRGPPGCSGSCTSQLRRAKRSPQSQAGTWSPAARLPVTRRVTRTSGEARPPSRGTETPSHALGSALGLEVFLTLWGEHTTQYVAYYRAVPPRPVSPQRV